MQPWIKNLGFVAVVCLAVIGGYVVARATLPSVQQGLDKLRCPELSSSTREEARAKSPRTLFGDAKPVKPTRHKSDDGPFFNYLFEKKADRLPAATSVAKAERTTIIAYPSQSEYDISLQYVGRAGLEAETDIVLAYRDKAQYWRSILPYENFGKWARYNPPPPGYSLQWH